MELFVIRNVSGEVIRSGFNNKMAAKAARAEFHMKEGIDESTIDPDTKLKYFVSRSSEMKFHVSRGKDHIKTKKK